MQVSIPAELQPYVRMSKKSGLVRSDDMPASLLPLFEQTKENIDRAFAQRKEELCRLMEDENGELTQATPDELSAATLSQDPRGRTSRSR